MLIILFNSHVIAVNSSMLKMQKLRLSNMLVCPTMYYVGER